MFDIGRRSALKLAAGLAVVPSVVRAQSAKITIATGVDPSFSAYYVAKKYGIFTKNGLEVTSTLDRAAPRWWRF